MLKGKILLVKAETAAAAAAQAKATTETVVLSYRVKHTSLKLSSSSKTH